jgi:hypothetical protein
VASKRFDADPTRLCTAVERARLALRRPRELRFNLVRKFAGTHYSEEGADKIQPLNMLSLYVNVVARQLAPKTPRVMLSTFNQAAKPTVYAMQAWLNKEIEKTELDRMFDRCVRDGLFGMGICKVGIATPADAAHFGWQVDAAEPYAESVDFDDFVFDLHARTWEEVTFIGHRVRRPLEVVKGDKNYQRGRKELQPSQDRLFNQQGDPRVSVIGRTVYQSSEQEFEDHVDLWEIYLPRHKCVYTLIANDNGSCQLCEDGEPLREQDWIGPDHGPYHLLGYGLIPGNLMFKAPLQDLADQSEFINVLYRKIIRQCDRQKTLLLVAGAADADGKRAVDAEDGEAIRVDNPERVKEVAFGGPSQLNWGVFVDAIQRFNFIAGNIEASGGLSPQATTATQDKMLAASASGAIQDKQEYTQIFVEDVLTSLAWFQHHHPTKDMKTQFQLPGLPDIGIPINASPQQRQQIPWDDLDVKLDVYSVAHSTPQSRANDLTQIVMQIITPMMQSLQQAGVQFDAQKFLKKLGEYKDMPDLAELLTLREPPQDPNGSSSGGASDDGAPKPAETTRNYVRTSQSERTQGATDKGLAAQLISGNSQGGAGGNGSRNGAMAH